MKRSGILVAPRRRKGPFTHAIFDAISDAI